MKELKVNRPLKFFLLGLLLLCGIIVAVSVAVDSPDVVSDIEGQHSVGEYSYHVNSSSFSATVVTEPEDLGGGVSLVYVQAGSADKPTVYPALTHYPGWFKPGQKVVVKTYTASGTNAFRDQFHVVYAF